METEVEMEGMYLQFKENQSSPAGIRSGGGVGSGAWGTCPFRASSRKCPCSHLDARHMVTRTLENKPFFSHPLHGSFGGRPEEAHMPGYEHFNVVLKVAQNFPFDSKMACMCGEVCLGNKNHGQQRNYGKGRG